MLNNISGGARAVVMVIGALAPIAMLAIPILGHPAGTIFTATYVVLGSIAGLTILFQNKKNKEAGIGGGKKRKRKSSVGDAEAGGEGFWDDEEEDDFWDDGSGGGRGGSGGSGGEDSGIDREVAAAYEATPSGREKTLLEFLDPLFLKVCGLHRVLATSERQDETAAMPLNYESIREEITALLKRLDEEANFQPSLRSQYDFLEQPIKWFLDCLFGTEDSRFPEEVWGTWKTKYLAEEVKDADGGTLTGGDLFFDDPKRGLDVLLDESKYPRNDPVNTERLAFFYVCIGLGLKGSYYDEPEKLKEYMNKIYPRISHLVDTEPEGMLTPDAYQGLNTGNFVEFAVQRPLILLAAFLGFVLAIILAYSWLYDERVDEFYNRLKNVMNVSSD